MAKSNYAAHKRLTPLKGDVVDDIRYWNNDAGQRRREDQAQKNFEDQEAAKEKERKRKIYDANIKPLNNYDTGSASLNEKQAYLLKEAEKQMTPLVETIATAEPGSKEYIQARLKLTKLQTLPSQMQTFTKSLTDKNTTYLKGVKDGSIWKDESWEKNFQEGYTNMEPGINEDGDLVVAFKDVDGDDVNDVMTYDSIQQVVPNGPNAIAKHDFKDLATSVAENIGTKTVQTDKGMVKQKIKEPDLTKVDTQVKSALYKNGEITSVAKSFLREMGYDYNNPKENELKEVEEAFKQEILSNIDTEDITDRDYNAGLQERKFNYKKSTDGNQVFDGEVDTEGLKDETGEQTTYLSKENIYQKNIIIPEGSVKISNIGGADSPINSGFINSVSLRKDKRLVVSGKFLKTKGKKFKVDGKEFSWEDLKEEANKGNEEAKAKLNAYNVPDNYGNFTKVVDNGTLSKSDLGKVLAVAEVGSIEALENKLLEANGKKPGTVEKIDEGMGFKANTKNTKNTKGNQNSSGITWE